KTTLHAFIKGMLFGLEKGRGKAAKNSTFQRYEPWENPNYYGGVLKFTSGGKRFCLERSFDRYSKKASLTCEDDGEILSIEHGDLEMLLGGLNASNFDNTVSVGQMRIETTQDLTSTLKDYANNYYGTGNSEIQLHGALELLKSKTKQAELRMQAILGETQAAQNKVQQESDYVWKDIHNLTEQLSALNEEIRLNQEMLEEMGKRMRSEQEKQEAAEKAKIQEKKWRVHPLAYLAMLVCMVTPFFALDRPWNYLWTLVILSAECLFVWNKLKDGKRKKINTSGNDQNMLQQLELIHKLEQAIEKSLWKKEHLHGELKEKQISYSNLQENLQELDIYNEVYLEQEQNKKALEFAQEQMLLISNTINQNFGTRLEEKASAILSSITGGKYSRLLLDSDLHMSLYTQQGKIAVEQVSRGTVEQIYFALRMAAADVLDMEELPVILDETFAYYDEERLQNTFLWLQQHKNQVIIFTCHKREVELLRQLGIAF
ncbi:MAG: hypothetical protein RR705_03845, partial [Lachnospiraceae bacterium]